MLQNLILVNESKIPTDQQASLVVHIARGVYFTFSMGMSSITHSCTCWK